MATVAGHAIERSEVAAWLPAFSGGGRKSPCASPAASESAACDVSRSLALGFLIRATWVRSEARHRHVRVEASAVERSLSSLRSSLPKGETFDRYLDRLGMTRDQLRTRIRLDELGRRLARAMFRTELDVTRADALAYYRNHRGEFVVPTRRSIRAVIARTERAAGRAKSALLSGRSWSSVLREYSTGLSRRFGGRMTVERSNALPRLRRAAFASPLHEPVGPLRIRSRWWVLEVESAHARRRMSPDEAMPRLETILRSTRETRSLDRLSAHLRSRYRSRTVCERPYNVPECRV